MGWFIAITIYHGSLSDNIHHGTSFWNNDTLYMPTWRILPTKLSCKSKYISHLQCTTRTTRTPAFLGYPPPPHDYPFVWVILDPKSKEDKVKVTNFTNVPKIQIFKFRNKLYTWHTFWSGLIRCANMKWIQWVLLKIQSWQNSVHRRTEGQTDRRTRWNQYTPLFNFVEADNQV